MILENLLILLIQEVFLLRKNIQFTDEGTKRESGNEITQDKIDKALALLEKWMRELESENEGE